FANKKQEFVKSDDKQVVKKADEKKQDVSRIKCYNCKKKGHFAKDYKKEKVKDYEYYKTKMLLAKKDKDKQVILAKDQAWMESSSDSDQEINANMVFMAQIEKVLSDSEASSSSADEKISEELVLKIRVIFKKTKDLRPTLYDEKVIGLGYTPMFLTYSDEALEIETFKRSIENKIKFAYDYGNLNASYVNEKINLEDDYFQEIINPDFDNIDSPFQQTSSLKPYVSNVILEKIIIDLEYEVVNLLKKEKVNLETIESLKSKSFESSENVSSESENQSKNDCLVVEKECDNEENPKVIAPGMFKLNVSQCVSPISMSKSSCDSNNVEIKLKRKRQNQSENDCLVVEKECDKDENPKVIAPGMFKMNDLLDDNNFFIFDDVNVRISPVSKMPFKKKPRDLMQVRSKSNMIKSLPRTVHKWLPKLQPLAKPVAKWFPRIVQIVQICLWIINSGCSKHMTGNCALLTNFVEKFIETVRFGNNVFAVIVGYGEECVRTDNGTEFKNKTLAKLFDVVGITQQFSAARTPQQNGVVERRNRTLVEAARTMLIFANLPLFLWVEALVTTCFTQNRLIIHKRFDKTPYELINKRKPNIKFFCVYGCRCYLLNDYDDVGKLREKGDIRVFVGYSKESVAFRI
nr:integrase, catalytic region, zinc finger, CCHC-type, peptidase aspartic, catalytic [Tanacetum cinerariifolium]GEX87485.1 integrase, catalytic region, zinc finger, CCHC-type, peptidase aspartic, catalytic [Tanacetum cinerariifolium]